MRMQWTAERVERVRALAAQGYQPSAIAWFVGASPHAVRAMMLRHKIPHADGRKGHLQRRSSRDRYPAAVRQTDTHAKFEDCEELPG